MEISHFCCNSPVQIMKVALAALGFNDFRGDMGRGVHQKVRSMCPYLCFLRACDYLLIKHLISSVCYTLIKSSASIIFTTVFK